MVWVLRDRNGVAVGLENEKYGQNNMNDSPSLWLKIIPRFARQRLTGRVGLQKIIANVSWLFVDQAIQIVTNLLVGVWVARYLGPEQRGVMLYATAFVMFFVRLSTLGLGEILVRELVREPNAKEELMGTVFVMQTASYLLFIPLMIGTIIVLRAGETAVHWAVGILAFGYLVAVLRVLQFWFQSQLQSKYAVWAMRCAGIVIAGSKILLIVMRASLMAFITVTALQVVLGFLGQLALYLWNGERFRVWRFDLARARILLHDGWPLVFSMLATTIHLGIDTVMLGHLMGDRAVGIYGEAARLSQMWYFIPVAIASSVSPALVQARKTLSLPHYRQRVQQFFDTLAATGYLLAVPAALVAPIVVNVLYGPAYVETGRVLGVHIWTFIFVSLRYGMKYWLMIENRTKFSMWATILGVGVNVGLNLWLVPLYGEIGAAWSTVAASAVSVYVVCLLSPQLFSLFRQLVLALLVPLRFRSLFAKG